jgi:diguanylate cyclase (GGDEF)-like protein
VEYSISSLVEDNVITGAVVVFRDITERKKHEENLEQMALYDQLTQIPNRRQFIEMLKKSLARAKRMGKHVGVLYLDLNDFKEVNDTRGHATGDLVLKAFAERLQPALREYDTVARLGGDEFAVIADTLAERKECVIIVERILRLLDEPLHTSDGDFKVSASIGIASYPDDADNYDNLITAADTAMYAAKKDKSKAYMFYEKP